MIILMLLVTCALFVMLTIAVANTRCFPQLSTCPTGTCFAGGPTPTMPPPISILIPARNEARVIGMTVQALLGQDYPHLEVIVLDDQSEDETAAAARRAASADPRLRVLSGRPLPPGWLGKNWACHQLALAARFDVLLFTDADVLWQPGALRAVLNHFCTSGADLLTVWPEQVTITWSERAVVPLMALALLAYLPIWLVHNSAHSLLAAANGQCMVFHRRAYCYSGGHAAIRGSVLEDVHLARRIKVTGLRLRMAGANKLLHTRMYHSWPEVRNGFAKNILAGHGGSFLLLSLSTLFHLMVFVVPWVWLFAGAFGWFAATHRQFPHLGVLWPFIMIGMGIGVRALTAAMTQQRIADALLMPLSVLLMTWIAGQTVWWRLRYGGPVWKGRILRGN